MWVRTVLVGLAIVAGVELAAPAGADPADLVPYCSGDQTPMDSNCRPSDSQVFTNPDSGLSPGLPFGVNPGQQPAI
ncbi:MAG: hypothetical protein QOJ80_4600 [Mycobacterium sp.]|nr:hypothetical protein [Mycobacterium sp.]